MTAPLVSYVMPVHNAVRFVEGAIRSVLAQTVQDLELVVVDDGSDDGSASLVRRLAAEDGRVRLVEQDHAGISAALNRGIEAAAGEWIARLDADDEALPSRTERQLAAAGQRPDVGVWSSWAVTIDVSGRVIGSARHGPETDAEFQRAHAAGAVEILHPTVLARRELLLRAGGYDSRFDGGEDLELWDRVGELAPILTIPEPLVRFRAHPTSLSTLRLREGLRIHRFVAARRTARNGGDDLTWDEFVRQETDAPVLRRLRRSGVERAAVAYRRAGVSVANGDVAAAVPRLLLSGLLRPVWVSRRLWRQFLRPRLRRGGE